MGPDMVHLSHVIVQGASQIGEVPAAREGRQRGVPLSPLVRAPGFTAHLEPGGPGR